ncbi:MAG TPA: potassium channel family protein [Gaiellaceae bacterium]|nr:potassium channel family protein [Gaiellaceae bacterium]
MASDPSPRAPRLLGLELTARSAGFAIAAFTLLATIVGGVVIWAVDREDFPTLGRALWWAAQTVTTVGYGDVVPSDPKGQVIAVLVILVGIGFVTVVTAAITASFVESARRRLRGEDTEEAQRRFDELAERLDRIEAALRERP